MPVNHLAEIECAIVFIEDNLTKQISLSSIAHEVDLSMYYFHRLFKAAIGETIGEYLRGRRLICAASDLYMSQTPITEIATRYQFSSQAAFSRAFKAEFGLPPGEFRQRHESATYQGSEYPSNKFRFISAETKILGIKRCCSFSHDKVLGLWRQFMTRIDEISTIQSFAFAGLYQNLRINELLDSTEFCYVAGVLTNSQFDPPDGMVCNTIPASRYMVLSHEDTLRTFGESHHQTFGAWLTKGRHRAKRPVIEIFPDFPIQNPVKYEIFLPIRENEYCWGQTAEGGAHKA